MTFRPTALIATLCALAPNLAFAHPGHGQTDPDSWTHYLTEPAHVIPLALAASAVLVAGLVWRRGKSKVD